MKELNNVLNFFFFNLRLISCFTKEYGKFGEICYMIMWSLRFWSHFTLVLTSSDGIVKHKFCSHCQSSFCLHCQAMSDNVKSSAAVIRDRLLMGDHLQPRHLPKHVRFSCHTTVTTPPGPSATPIVTRVYQPSSLSLLSSSLIVANCERGHVQR